MTKLSKMLLIIGGMFLLFGCAKEQVYESLYGGMNFREEMVRPSGEPGATTPPPSYQTYKRERDEVIGSDGQ